MRLKVKPEMYKTFKMTNSLENWMVPACSTVTSELFDSLTDIGLIL